MSREKNHFREIGLHDFVVKAWPVNCGSRSTLSGWIEKAFIAFPDVDLEKEAKKAFMWEAARPSRTKKSIRRFLTNWWSNSQDRFAGKPAKVVPIEAAKWLRRNNKAPDYLFKSWVGDRGLSEGSIESFCDYFALAKPECFEEVMDVYREGM